MPLLLTCAEISAQEQEGYISRDTFSFNYAVETVGDDIYLNVASTWRFESGERKQRILKLSSQLNVIDSLDLSGFDKPRADYQLKIQQIKKLGKDTLGIVMNEFVTDTLPEGSIKRWHIAHLLRVSESLEIYDTLSLFPADTLSYRIFRIEKIKGNYILCGSVEDTADAVANPFLKVIDPQFNPLKYIEFANNPFGTADAGFTQVIPYADTLLAYAFFFDFANVFVFYDDSLNYLSHTWTHDPAYPDLVMPLGGKLVADAGGNKPPIFISSVYRYKYGLPPPALIIDKFYFLGIGKFSNQLMVRIDTLKFCGSNYLTDTLNHGGISTPSPGITGVDGSVADSVIIAMAAQAYYMINYSDKFPNEVYIYNYNARTETLNWMRKYVSGYANSAVVSARAMPRNKFLIVLNEYNWDIDTNYNMRVHLMILNGNGDILTQKEFKTYSEPFRVSPNPFSDEILVRGLPPECNKLEYSIYSVDGRLLEQGSFFNGDYIPITATLSKDPYLLRISDRGKTLGAQKIQKL